VFDSEFNAAVAETSTSDAAFIVADLSKKLALCERVGINFLVGRTFNYFRSL